MPRKKLLIAAALAAALVPAGAALTSTRAGAPGLPQESAVLMPGVTYSRQVQFTPRGPVVLDVVTAPRPDGSLYTLAPVLSGGVLGGAQSLTSLEAGLSSAATVVGVNGDYFSSRSGHPSGILMSGGVLDSEPAGARSSLGISADGTLSVARVSYRGTWQGTGQRRRLDLDAAPAKGRTTLYTSAWGPATPQETGVLEAVFSSFPPTRPNQPLTATVSGVSGTGGTPIPPGGAVIVARGAQVPILGSDAPVGASVEVRLTLTPDWSGLASAIGGGPVLVADGKPVFNARESFAPGTLNRRNARSAVGQLSDGRVLLVTVEGGSPAYSVGMTNYELGIALARLGAVTAIALGSGGPASLSFDGALLTRPSAGAEQPVSDALVLSYAGVYAAPPSSDVLSPNGDGVDDEETFAYKLVRPAHVGATLTGPDGTAITLVDDEEQPGVHTLTWNGLNADGSAAAEGRWRFSVTATDEQGRATTADRSFALDETLGALAVEPAAARLAARAKAVVRATFALVHPAQVVVTIEKRSGVVIATLLDETLDPGEQSVAWNGRDWTGALAYTGAYQVHVVAENDTGTVSLLAPFVARRS